MRTGIVAFLLGNVLLLYRPELPLLQSIYWLICLILFLFLVLYKYHVLIVRHCSSCQPVILVSVCFLCGFVYTGWYIHSNVSALDWQNREATDIRVTGTVASIPELSDKRQRFDFTIDAIHTDVKLEKRFAGKVKLSWYQVKSRVKIGQHWQFEVRLKKPNGSLNPGGFDYEKWLYQNRILATGYVRHSKFNRPVQRNNSVLLSVTTLRQQIAATLDSILQNYPYKGLVKALTLGIKSDIEHNQWKTFIDTGTNHLIAISGLHIGLMASITWMFVFWLWRLSSFLNSFVPAFYIASGSAFLMACFYAALAGFAIPTQRALIMLGVIFLVAGFKRELPVSYILLYALLTVLLVDPLASLSPGFWLSFTAVAIIFFSVSNRIYNRSTFINSLVNTILMQWRIFIGLIPVMAIFMHQFSLIAPVANFIAIPLMSLVIVPLTLLASMMGIIYEPFSAALFVILQWPIKWLLVWLDWVNFPILSETGMTNSNMVWYLGDPGWFIIMLSMLGSVWLLMPKSIPGRWLGVLLFLPALLHSADKIEPGNVQMTVLDVGQGLAVIIRTANHTLLYDTGDKYSEAFNFADQVIIPFARISAISHFDKVIISNGDKDHAGSINEILATFNVETLYTSEPDRLVVNQDKFSKNIITCAQGQSWEWDDVKFQFLAPVAEKKYYKSNNRSCVLQLTLTSGQSFLLTGDIEKVAEKQLLADYPELEADVLLVPHHGSKTSSSMNFISQLKPEIAVFSYGYRNRFHFPAKTILKRYQSMNIKLFNTTNGALDINSNISNNSWTIKQYRYSNRHFWHREPENL